jgi:hypothetical protein
MQTTVASFRVHAQQPYAAKGQRTLCNAADGFYQGVGSQLLLTPVKSRDGYATTFAMGLGLSNTKMGASDSNAGRRRSRRARRNAGRGRTAQRDTRPTT